ncbi:hypothetical protein SRHO_G00007130 [Serrasalmus rhombeus]
MCQWLADAVPVTESENGNVESEVRPEDSISNVSSKGSRHKSQLSACSKSSSISSMRIKTKAERAALLKSAAVLKKVHDLDAEEEALQIERARLRRKKERLEMEAKLEANTAKLYVLENDGGGGCGDDGGGAADDEDEGEGGNAMNAYLHAQLQLSNVSVSHPKPVVLHQDNAAPLVVRPKDKCISHGPNYPLPSVQIPSRRPAAPSDNCGPRSNNPAPMQHQLPPPARRNPSTQTQASYAVSSGAGKDECVLSIVPVQVKAKSGSHIINTDAFLDPGSSASFCTETLMRKLNLAGAKTNILLRTLGQERTVSTFSFKGLQISGLTQETFLDLPEVFTEKTMPVSRNNILIQEDLEEWAYLKDINIPSLEADVELLIGTNAQKLMEPWEVINSHGEGPYAIRTLLGWVVSGPLKGREDKGRYDCPAVTANRISVTKLQDLLIAQYNQDFNEATADDSSMSREDHRFMQIVESSIHQDEGHYCFDLPFKAAEVMLPDNRVAEQRLFSLQGKFKRNKEFHQEYTEFMSEVITNGYAEPVPCQQLNRSDGRLWFLPHHGVYHPKKKTLRVVFDCASVYQGISLNSQLLQGPFLTSTLLGVLTRFRKECVALMADIQAMFHQWSNWLTNLHHVAELKVNRCMKPDNFGETTCMQLHHFSDASEYGYGTATYLRMENKENQVSLAFILGKARVAPLKQTTIPRLEMTAAVLAARLDKMLRRELQLDLQPSVFWTDTTTVLKYIANETRRGMLLTLSQKRKLLKPELQKERIKVTGKPLTPVDLQRAEEAIIRFYQQEKFPKEISTLQEGKPVMCSSDLHKLDPVLQDGMLRVGGRLNRAAMPEEEKHPVILTKDQNVFKLILKHIHQCLGLAGCNHMLSFLRKKYWITHANSACRKVISECTECRHFQGNMGQQKMADLTE